ncbi:MAG: acetylglutamate kinase [Gemmatimonadota bacterium]
MLNVVKLGGAAAANAEVLRRTASAVRALGGRTVVVHGGGVEISTWQERLGMPVTWRDGLRVTTPEGLQVTAMVLSGWVIKRIVQAFMVVGAPAVGISGEDGGLLEAIHAQGGALGEVGEVIRVKPDLVEALLTAGFLPVVSPLSRGPGGVPLNVNADEAALQLAAGMGATRLYLVSDVPGVRVGGAVVPTLTPSEARRLLDDHVATGGMSVKLRQALRAADLGVEVAIGGPSLLDDIGNGTRILGAPRKAEVA